MEREDFSTNSEKKNNSLVASAMRHKSITLLLMAVMMIAGMVSLVYIPKDEFPQFDLPIGVVVGVYPGASETEVEQQLARPMEQFLWTFKEIDKSRVTTVSQNGMCYAIVFLNSSVKNTTEFWNKLKERLPLLRLQLPSGVLAVVANDDFGEVSSMLITLESEQKTFRELNEYTDQLSDRLRTIPSLANIYRLGSQKEQIGVYLDRNLLPAYGLNTATVYSKLSGQTGTIVTGTFDDGQLSRDLHLVPTLNTEQQLAQTIVYSDPSGAVVRLGDIADIKREYPDEKRTIRNNGHKCVMLSLQMTKGNNIVQFGKEVKQIIADFQETLPPDVHVNTVTDQSEVVGNSISEFLVEIIIAILSVIIAVMLMLPMRVAGVAVMTIPITIFASIAIFFALGIEINTVTLAAMIVTLGMIVDDSVVVVDCYMDMLDEGVPRWKAAVASARKFTASIITATLAISITFFPLIFTTDNIIHDFIQWFPYSLAIVLTVSLLVALFVVPILEYHLIKKGLGQRPPGILSIMQKGYDRIIAVCFRRRLLTLGVGLAAIVIGGFLFTLVPQKLMPRASRSLFTAEVYMHSGTDIKRTQQITDSLASILKADPRITGLTIFYGSGSPRFHAAFIPQFGGSNFAQLIVNTHSDREAQEVLDDYTDRMANYFPEAQVLFKQIEYTDAPYPIIVRLVGSNLDSLHVATDSVVRRLHANPQMLTVNTRWGTTQSRLDITLHPEEANRIGMSKSLLAMNLAMRYAGGIPAASIWEGETELPVMLRDADQGRQDVEAFRDIRVSGILPTITTVPLSQVANVEPGWSDGAILRTNGIRTAEIFGTISRDAKVGTLTRDIYRDLQTLRLPEGITIEKGGQAKTESTYRPQIYLGTGIAVIIIAFILLFHLKSIPLMLLMMASLLFAIPGAALGLFFSDYEFGATAILGLISLMGIIARCGIIMVDYAEELRQENDGISIREAALTSARRRFRPIFLTSAAASMGVIPMVAKATPLWGPMGIVICVGAFVSMFFIVTMIPVGYSLIIEKLTAKKKPQDEEYS